MNLATPFVACVEPVACPSRSLTLPADSSFAQASRDSQGVLVWAWTLWDSVDVVDPAQELTLQGLIDKVEADLGVHLHMVMEVTSSRILYSDFAVSAAASARLRTRCGLEACVGLLLLSLATACIQCC